MSVIRTVTGDIAPEQLGITAMHEHLLGAPPKEYAEADPDLVLDDENAALRDLAEFHAAGGRAMVEMTPIDYHRDPAGLKRLSERSGVHIICITGFLKDKFSAPFVKDETVESLADRFTREIESGIGKTGVRAGVIKAASSLNAIKPLEEKVFRAAARAHLQTGALISTHTEAGTMALEQVDLLTSEGVRPSRILIGHMDRLLDYDYHVAVAQRGVYLGYDHIGKAKYYPDNVRAALVLRLIKAGYGNQIVFSSDLARKSYFPGYGPDGKPGFGHVLTQFVPRLRALGLDDAAIITILIANPARALTLAT